MALATTEVTYEGITREFYVTSVENGTTFGIPTDGVSDIDVDALEDADENGTGADLKEKLDGYKLKTTGQDGYKTYSPLIRDVEAFVAAQFRLKAQNNAGRFIKENRDLINDIGV